MVVDVAAASPGGAAADAASGRSRAHGAALAAQGGVSLCVKVAARAVGRGGGAGSQIADWGWVPGSGHALETGEAGDAVGALCIEGTGSWVLGV